MRHPGHPGVPDWPGHRQRISHRVDHLSRATSSATRQQSSHSVCAPHKWCQNPLPPNKADQDPVAVIPADAYLDVLTIIDSGIDFDATLTGDRLTLHL